MGRNRRRRRRSNRARERDGGAVPFKKRASAQTGNAGAKETTFVKNGRAGGANAVGRQAKVKVGGSARGEAEENAGARSILQRSAIGAINMGKDCAAENTQ